MTTAPHDPPTWDRCAALAVPLTATERRTLDVFLQPVEVVPDQLRCELAAEHTGDHAAYAAATRDGDQWWWLTWSPTSRLVYPADPCDHEQHHDGHPDSCLLPRDHPGPYSYDLRPPPNPA